MADSQSLFDTLAGSFGHGVDRPGLNAFVANSQANNGLRTAQTEEALNNAQMQQEEMQAHADLESSLASTLGDDGKPLLQPSQAHLVANELKGHFGNAQNVMQALRETQQARNTGILSNPANLNTPEATAAASGLAGKLPEPVKVPDAYSVAPGMTPPVVQQTPLEAAKTGLTTMQATHPELFHTPGAGNLDPQTASEVAEFIRENPNLAGNLRSLVSNGGAQVVHQFLHPESAGGPPGVPSPATSGVTPPLAGAAVPGATAPKGIVSPASGATPAAPSTQPSATAPANGVLPAPGVSLHEQALIRNDFANGLGAKQTSALNTMVQHSNLFDAIADQLQNGNFTPTNAISQMWQKTFGSAVPSNLQIAGSFLGREAVRATVNAGAGTGQERELAVSDSSSPDALHGAAQTLRSLAAGQLHSLELRARRGGVDITQLLGPEARAAYGVGTAPAASGPGNTPTFNTETEAAAANLPSGTKVIVGGVPGTWH